MTAQPDRELVALARSGDGAAIGELFTRYWRAARAAAFGVTGELAAAEDAASEGFQEALRGLDSLREPQRFGAWLRTIVVRKAQAGLQNRAAPLKAAAEPAGPADDTLERFELAAIVQTAVRDLPEHLREAVALFYFEGYDTDAAARFLGIPAGTLRRRLHDGRARLREIVEQIYKGRHPMDSKDEDRWLELKGRFESGDIFLALKEAMSLRPPPEGLRELLLARLPEPPPPMVERAQRLLTPSAEALDPNHPIGAAAAAIRAALPEFENWELDPREALRPFRLVLPPGFEEGRPGSFIRATRALLRQEENGSVRTIYEHVQASRDEQDFRAGMGTTRSCDVLDLTWMVSGRLELRPVPAIARTAGEWSRGGSAAAIFGLR